MAEIYIFEELPIIDAPQTALTPLYVEVPPLQEYVYSREYGVTIYSKEAESPLAATTHAYEGRAAYDHWMRSLPLGLFPRFVAAILLRWIRTKTIHVDGWEGRAIVASGRAFTEIHLLVYSQAADISLDFHLESQSRADSVYSEALQFLAEVRRTVAGGSGG